MAMLSIHPEKLYTAEELHEVILSGADIELSSEAKAKIRVCRDFLEKEVLEKDKVVYGINTGFGSLCNTVIEKEKLGLLQENLVRSHACGAGKKIDKSLSQWMLLFKIISFSKGYSGVTVELVEHMIDTYNHGLFPVIYEMGSLGASGDLAPLAHLALGLIGEGEFWDGENTISASKAFNSKGLKAIKLVEKEGLAILNGTQFMQAHLADAMLRSDKAVAWAMAIGALSTDAFDGLYEPFLPSIHKIRGQTGQIRAAKKIQEWLEGSEIGKTSKKQVQDPYSFRCMPQVIGAIWDGLEHIRETLYTEINGVTDNPNVVPEESAVYSGGNFHGQPLAFALDYLGILMAELGNIAERRTYQLLSGCRGLPEFLAIEPGIQSGFMIPQYTAASMVSVNKQLATPSSVDSIPSSNGQEDHVSMGANSGIKALKILSNVEQVIAIELMTASQALSFRKNKTSKKLESILSSFRNEVQPRDNDGVLYHDMKKALLFIEKNSPYALA